MKNVNGTWDPHPLANAIKNFHFFNPPLILLRSFLISFLLFELDCLVSLSQYYPLFGSGQHCVHSVFLSFADQTVAKKSSTTRMIDHRYLKHNSQHCQRHNRGGRLKCFCFNRRVIKTSCSCKDNSELMLRLSKAIYKISSSLCIKHGTKFVLICHQIVNNLLSTIRKINLNISNEITFELASYSARVTSIKF